MLPSPGQGAIAVVHKKENFHNKKICSIIDCKETRIPLTAERALITRINGDCYTPIAAYAKIKDKRLILKARLFSNDIEKFVEEEKTSSLSSISLLGKECADSLLRKLKNIDEK